MGGVLVNQQPMQMKIVLAVVAMLALMVASSVPTFAQEEVAGEIAVTGVVSYQGAKADGTPVYGIADGKKGYLIEGDYSAYVGKRLTVHGVPESGHAERVLDVTWIE